MNNKQENLSWGAIIVFVVTIFFAPWETTRVDLHSGTVTVKNWHLPLFDPPSPGPMAERIQLRQDVLAFEWIAIGLLYGALFFVLKDPSRTTETRKRSPVPDSSDRP